MNGIILVNKPYGCTSRDVVNKVSKIFNTKKVGHTGTLDPIATGVLVICVGRATKLVDYLTSTTKEYIATIELGTLTDTLDITGNVIRKELVNLTNEEIVNCLNSFKKTYSQEVPIYSAVKINGKKLYEYARENIKVDLPKRDVTIYDISLVSDIIRENNKIKFQFKCLVSKGTYIRSLINDIATSLNTIGIMSNLIRTKQGKFEIDNCKDVENISDKDIIPVIDVIDDICKVKVNDVLQKDILNGKIIVNKYNAEKVLFIADNNLVLALYKTYLKDNTMLKPDIMLGGI